MVSIDGIDEQIVYHLSRDARHTSAPDIAETVDVSPPTIRNRIRRLEDNGVIKGYHAHVDYEKIDGRLANLFLCTATTTGRKRFAKRVLDVSGVVHVREVMTGEEDLHVKAIADDTGDIRRIAKEISALGVHIEDEDLLRRDHFRAYAPFGPPGTEETTSVTGVADLSEDADVIEVTVTETAPMVEKTLEAATDDGLVPQDVLVIAVDRDDHDGLMTPTGETRIEAGDVVTLFSRTGIADGTLRAFTGDR